jgi:hypothetical protein
LTTIKSYLRILRDAFDHFGDRMRRLERGDGHRPQASQWRWPDRNLAGNTIDFFVQVLGMSFHDAMRQIIAS